MDYNELEVLSVNGIAISYDWGTVIVFENDRGEKIRVRMENEAAKKLGESLSIRLQGIT